MGARPWRRAALALFGSLPLSAAAAGWTITPDITLTGTWHDNPTLATPGAARSDFVTTVAPGLRIEGTGRRVRAQFAYRPSAVFYARNSEHNDILNSLSASGRLEAIERFFFIDAEASIAQNFISPLGERPTDPTTITANRTETRTYGISPFVQGELGRGYQYEVRNRNTWTNASAGALGDVQRTQWSARLASPLRLFGWALDADDSRTRYDAPAARGDLETRLVRGSLFFQPDPAWRLSASAGREQNNYALGEERSSSMHGAGVAWNPGVRTNASFNYEKRFFGPSRFARLNHRTRLTAWNLAYSRSTSEFQQELLRLPPGNTAALLDAIFAARIPDPVERRAAVERFMRASGTPEFLSGPLAFFTQQVFLQERLEGSVALLGVRNSLAFTAFTSESTSLTQEFAGPVPDAFLAGQRIRQRGFGLRGDHRFTPFTSIGGNLGRTFARQEEPAGADSRNDQLALTVNHTLSPRTTTFGGVGVNRFTQAQDRRETRSVFVGLNHRF